MGVGSGGEEAFIWGNGEAVDLGIGVLDGSGTDAGPGFPEPNCVVVASCYEEDGEGVLRSGSLGRGGCLCCSVLRVDFSRGGRGRAAGG